MIRAGIYCRVSTEEQAKHGISLDCQQQALTEYATKHQYQIVDYYVDDGYSGTSLKRPELQRLLNDVRANKIDIVLITKLDRWGRGVKNYYKVDDILTSNNVHWKTILEDYDTTTSAGKLHINIMLSIAENEASVTSDRIKFVFQEKLKRKEVVTGRCPPGYKIENKKYVIDEEDANMVRHAFELFLELGTTRMTRIKINEIYGKKFSDKSFKQLLSRKLYIGIYEGRNFYAENFCDPIVSKELFDKVQKLREHNVKVYSTDQTKVRDYIFSGIITCEECKRKLSGKLCKSGSQKKKARYSTGAYICSSYRSTGSCCNNHSISEKKIEFFLLSQLRRKLENKLWELKDVQNEEPVKPKRSINNAKIKKQIEDLLNLYLEGNITKEIYNKKYSHLLTLLEDENESIKIKKEEKIDIKNISNLLDSPLEEIYLKMNSKERRRFWRDIVKEITFTKDQKLDFELLN